MHCAPDPRLARELYQRLIQGPHDVGAVARRCGLSVSTIYALAEGRRRIPAEYVPRLTHATHDLSLFDALTGAKDIGVGTFWLPSPDVKASEETSTLEALRVASSFVSTALEALRDNRLTETERADLRARVREVMARCRELEVALGNGDND